MRSNIEIPRTLIEEGRAGEAIRLLSGHVTEYPDDFDARMLLGIAYGQTGDFQQACDVLSSALRLEPDHAICWYNLGLARQNAGEIDAAVASYARARLLKPGYAPARTALRSLRPEMDPDDPEQLRRLERSIPLTTPPASAAVIDRVPATAVSSPDPSLEWGEDAIASLYLRWLALFVDSLAVSTIFGFIGGVFDLWILTGFFYLPELIYETIALGYWGQTIGKAIVGIQVDGIDGSDITWSVALFRAGLKYGLPVVVGALVQWLLPPRLVIVAWIAPMLPYLWVFTNRNRRALHDVLARTIVVRA